MNIPAKEDLPNILPSALAGRLLAAGTALRGRNLRKTSWLEIAVGLRQTGVARVVLPRLAAAVTREDALRVLRFVRKHGRGGRSHHRKAGRSRVRGRGAATREDFGEASGDASWESTECDNDCDDWDRDRWYFWNRTTFEYRAWQAWDVLISGTGIPSFRDGIPASMWEAMKSVARSVPSGTVSAAVHDEPKRRAVRAAELFDLLRSILHGDAEGSILPQSNVVTGITYADAQTLSTLIVEHRISGSGSPERRLEDHTALIMMLMLSPLWVRRPSTWHAPDAGRRDKVRSLADHLFVLYPIPPAMYLAWDLIEPWNNIVWSWKAVICFILLGQGFNLRRIGRQFGWRFPRGFVECLWKAPPCNDLWSAFLMAEVMRLGASPVEYWRVRRHGMFRTDFTGNPGLFPDEFRDDRRLPPRDPADQHRQEIRFLDDTIVWLAQHRDELTDDMCATLLDWAEHMHNRLPEQFSLVGRASVAALDAARAHAESITSDQRPELSWQPKGWDWEATITSGAWAIRELLSTKDLIMEGDAMCHCVGDYDSKCMQGHSAIFSVTQQGSRALTLEVDIESLTIAEVKGVFNRLPTREERAVIQQWYEKVVLRLRSRGEVDNL